MLVQKMLQAGQKLMHMPEIMAVVGRTDIINDHVPDCLDAVLLLEKRAG